MPNWKKVAISGSNVSQFNNDGTYVKMNGSTANGVLTYQAADCAAVESAITYDGTIQRLVNNGQINLYSGSQFSSAPSINGATGLKVSTSGNAGVIGCGWSWDSGSRNFTISAVSRYADFGTNSDCSTTLAIVSQLGNSSKNASVELTTLAKEDGKHHAIFSVGVRCDNNNANQAYVPERLRIDGQDETIFLSGSVSVKTEYMASTASVDNVLVYDSNTGEIKKSTLTPSTSTASPGGSSGNVQYNDGSGGFDGESSFTYNAATDKLTIKNPGTGAGGLITNNIEGGGSTLVINDGGNDQNIQICTYGADSLELGDGSVNIYGQVFASDLTTTTATNCPSVVVSTTGELLAGPVGGTSQTLQQVTTAGNTTSNPIVFDGSSTTNNCLKVEDNNQSGTGRPLLIKGSDNGSTTAGVGGNISICAGNATGVSGAGDGGTILIKGGTTTNAGSDPGYVCVEGHGLVVPNGQSSEPGIAFAGDVSMGLWRTSDCVVISRDGTQGTTNHYFGADGYKICDGALAVGNISYSTTTGRIDASNDIVAYSTSDCRLKKYVKPIKNALDKIDKIRGVEFDWKITDEKMKKEIHSFEGHDVGVLAQEIEEVLPEVVTTRDSGYKAVRYEKIVPLLIQGIKELKDEVEILKSKI